MVTTCSGQDIRLFDQTSPRAAEMLRELHEEILLPSFPPQQYVPPATISPRDHLAVIACADDGRVLGGALGEIYPRSGSLLLGYLAVRPGHRGAGVGSVLLAAARERWLTQRPVMFLELDDPRHHTPHPGYGDPEARLRFYGTFGVRLLAIPYFQPRLRAQLPRVYGMFLAALPALGFRLPQAMPASQVSAFLREYFEACEGGAADDDAEVRWLLGSVHGPEIALVGVDQAAQVPDLSPPGRP
jgi:GNAT superfamily N-acetyltransferase